MNLTNALLTYRVLLYVKAFVVIDHWSVTMEWLRSAYLYNRGWRSEHTLWHM